ncbi:hypothetical protein PHJA_001861200 [Phtheirospermum japonicum]|uniref:S-protein homolog n=1 Tax=Phtheirospermum japonicum TaxID=374723 RepID=A0A830CRZ7_9LAMI|nr:hypothetical protein PHJA_001861200 [Phtheirospermum japonicum]
MNVHCRSRENDLGYHVLQVEDAIEWSFNQNLWGTTLFYCDMQWADSNWYNFDAYDSGRDNNRCKTMCRWMITKEGSLYGYNEETGFWEWFQLRSVR